MYFKQKMKKMGAILVSGALLMSVTAVLPVAQVNAASDCVINPDTQYQVIKGFGGMNHPEWAGDLTAAQRETAFGNGANQLGLSICRIFVNDDRTQWSRALATAKDAQAKGAIVFASPWNAPASMSETFSKANDADAKRVKKSSYAAYAQHLNDFVHYMKDNGVELYAISMQNEPDWGFDWTWWTEDECVDFMANYAGVIDCPVMSPESFSYKKSFYDKILNNSQAYANTDIFGTHFYGTSRDNMNYPALENCGKEIFMTEVYTDSKSDADVWPLALDVAENIHNGMAIGNMNAYVWWYIRRSYGPMKENGSISKRGYCMAQYSKFIRPGDVRIAATEQPATDIFVSAYKNDEDQLTIVAVNGTDNGYSQNFTIDGEKIADVDRYRTSSSENLAVTNDLEHTESSFYAQLPAQSVSTFVVSVSNAPITPDANGYYFHSTFEGDVDGWTGHGSSSVLLSGKTPYAGSEALLVQERAKAWNGAERALNKAAFVPGQAYSFSANVVCPDGAATQNFFMKLQYTDASGTTQYSSIAEATAVQGSYVQLANTNYTIPSGATDLRLYIETETGTDNFYIDEAIGAVAGIKIAGPAATTLTRGDVNSDGCINALDLALAKRGMMKGFSSTLAQLAADVDESGKVDAADMQQLQDFILRKIKAFEIATPVLDTQAMAQTFASVNLGTCLKTTAQTNSLITQYFGADPGVLNYNGRIYIYMTDDHLLYANNAVSSNVYSQINKLRCISSADLVNWTDHGLIDVAGTSGIAKWAGCAWAPTACHKTINGKEKFFLYFANNANGIGVLTADSPTGPWTDPNGKAMIDRKTTNCTDIPWVFDPAVLVDDDGTGYLYFGGGVPEINGTKQSANPKSARVVKLNAAMTGIEGTPQLIDAPYIFEDSGINKIGNKYYYSYCSNWSTGGNSYGMTSAAIEYMVSDSPMGPFTYGGEVFKNIGTFFGTVGNNHHTIFEFNGSYYLAYHTQKLMDLMGIKGLDNGYRSTHLDKLTVSNGKLGAVTGTMNGVSQVGTLNPYTVNQAETIFRQSGITITGTGDTKVTGIASGDWFGVKGAAFTKGATQVKIRLSSQNGGAIKICSGSETGTAVGFAKVAATGGSYTDVIVPISGLSGTQDVYFIFSDAMDVDSWVFS